MKWAHVSVRVRGHMAEHSSLQTKKLALGRSEAAEALGVSPITIDRLTKRGLLKPSRATRRPLYSIPELERFLKDTTTSLASCTR